MRKLKLDADSLAVQSFATTGGKTGLPQGTVEGQETRYSQDVQCSNTMPYGACDGNTACGGCETFGYTCDRESCWWYCQSKYPCIPGGGGTATACGGITSCNCGDGTNAGCTADTCGMTVCGEQTA